LRGGPQGADRGAVLQVPGGAVVQPRAVGNLGIAGAAAQFRAQIFRGRDDQRLEVVDGGGAGGDGPCPGRHQNPQGLAVPAAARFDEVIAAKDLAGGPDSIQRVTLSAASPRWAFGTAHLNDAFTLPQKELGEPGAIAAGALHGPAPLVRQITQGKAQQMLITIGVGRGLRAGHHRPGRGDRGGGESVAVGIDADDAVDGLGQYVHVVPLVQTAAMSVRAGRGGGTQAEL